jgi:hypothetical protein
MAARQGFTAHISQASEDAKRAVLSRAPTAIKSHYWLNNLNTTCTIKSAPPRSPEVMEMLSTHSGWLVKRNEQHVWQRRWCCVVPHMFLYYFEAEPEHEDGDDGYETKEGFSGGGIYRSDALIVENQDMLNDAVRNGYTRHNNRSSASPSRGSDSFAERKNTPSPTMLERKYTAPVRGPTTRSNDLSPSGIIDLECYSSVKQSSVHELVFELTGDPITNPDLRSFYFQAGSQDDLEIWTKALLSDRHSALKDEREAYRQVCDSFQLQLQNMSDMIDTAEGKTADTERQLYNVRSQAQKFRTQIVAIVREAFEQSSWQKSVQEGNTNDATEKIIESLEQARLTCLDQLDEIVSSADCGRLSKDYGALTVQLLADYLATVVGSYTDLNVQLNSAQQKLTKSEGVDHAVVSDMKLKLDNLEAERNEEKSAYEAKIAAMEERLKESQNATVELRNQMNTQRMDFSMFQSQAKSKLQELSAHKKILKKEVIHLRKKVEEIESERDAALHITSSVKSTVESEKEKNQVLEKYIENMENQVRVQQNMMEMISLSGMSDVRSRNGSVVGRIIGSSDDQSFSSFGQLMSEPQFAARDSSGSLRLPPSIKSVKAKIPSSAITSNDNNDIAMATPRGMLDAQLQAKDRHDDHRKMALPPKIANRFPFETHDDDNQSTFSELTEDRTQRAFDAAPRIHYTTSDMTGQNILTSENDGEGEVKYEKISNDENNRYPPKYIIGGPDETTSQKTSKTDKIDDSQSKASRVESVISIHSESSGGSKLSVAQRARLAADQSSSNSVDVSNALPTNTTNEKTISNKGPRTRSRSPGVFQQLGRRVVTAIDNSPLGVKLPEDTVTQKPKAEDKDAVVSGEPKLTLEERQRIQRERQIQMLKAKGLIKDEGDIRGGAGSESISPSRRDRKKT